MVLVTFHCCCKIPSENHLKGENNYFVSQLQRFQTMKLLSGLWQVRNTMMEGHSRGKLFTSGHTGQFGVISPRD
jgi:hypothetical protein